MAKGTSTARKADFVEWFPRARWQRVSLILSLVDLRVHECDTCVNMRVLKKRLKATSETKDGKQKNRSKWRMKIVWEGRRGRVGMIARERRYSSCRRGKLRHMAERTSDGRPEGGGGAGVLFGNSYPLRYQMR